MWYHAGSFLFRDFDSFLGMKVSLCLLAVFSRAVTGLGVCGAVCLVRLEGRIEVRNMLTSDCCVIPLLLIQFIIASVTKAHVGRFGESCRYDFSHVNSITWFHVSMSSRFIPPSFLGFMSCCRPSPGGNLSLFQINDLMTDCIVFVMVPGIPCAFVRNCVIPPTIICMISLFMSRVGFVTAHCFSLSCILSIIGDHGCVWSTLFPIQAPRTLVGSLSLVILISRLSGASSSCSFCELYTLSLWAVDPIGMISVFSRLNFALEALHQTVSNFSRSEYLSDAERYTVVSSAYRFILTVVFEPGMS